jgi:hypothetical protein
MTVIALDILTRRRTNREVVGIGRSCTEICAYETTYMKGFLNTQVVQDEMKGEVTEGSTEPVLV